MAKIAASDPMFIIYVHDMDRAVGFYADVFGFRLVQHTPGWSMFRIGDATLALHGLFEGSSESPLPHAGLNFQVDNLDEAIEAALAAGAEHIVTRGPTSFVPVRMCEMKDPDGNGFEFRQFVGPGEDLTRA